MVGRGCFSFFQTYRRVAFEDRVFIKYQIKIILDDIIREQDASFSPFFFVLSIFIFYPQSSFLSTDYHRFYLGTETHGFFRAVSIRA